MGKTLFKMVRKNDKFKDLQLMTTIFQLLFSDAALSLFESLFTCPAFKILVTSQSTLKAQVLSAKSVPE